MSPNNMIVELLNHPYERTLADLDQEFRESIDPEEEALRREESKEQSQLADALDAEIAQRSPRQRKIIADLEQEAQDNARDEARRCEFAEFLRIQAVQEQLLTENLTSYWLS